MSTETCQIITDEDSNIYHLKITSGKFSVIVYQFFVNGISTDQLQKFVDTAGSEKVQIGEDLSHQVTLVPNNDQVEIQTINHGPGSWTCITVSKETLLPTLQELLHTVSDEENIIGFIRQKRKEGFKDSEIDGMVRAKFSGYNFTFGACADMDLKLGRNSIGGYWRTAYNWPIKGDCGFFTFKD